MNLNAYRYTFFDDETHTAVGVFVIYWPDDATAEASGRNFLRMSNHLGVDVWQGSRHIFSRTKEFTPPPVTERRPSTSRHPSPRSS